LFGLLIERSREAIDICYTYFTLVVSCNGE
jgi:hypothetical protein